MVFLGDRSLPLPLMIPLGNDGRSADPLDIRLAYDRARGEATVTLRGETFRLAASSSESRIPITLAAGAGAGWTIDGLEVTNDHPTEEAGSTQVDSLVPGMPAGGDRTKPARVTNPALHAAERKHAQLEASAYYRAKDHVQGEAALLRANRHPPGTFGWHIESAGKLTQMALTLRQRYDHRGAIQLARRALEVVGEAEPLSRGADAGQRATLRAMAGFIQEELLRDRAAAQRAYEEARQLDPKSPRAQAGLARLAEASAKSGRMGGGR